MISRRTFFGALAGLAAAVGLGRVARAAAKPSKRLVRGVAHLSTPDARLWVMSSEDYLAGMRREVPVIAHDDSAKPIGRVVRCDVKYGAALVTAEIDLAAARKYGITEESLRVMRWNSCYTTREKLIDGPLVMHKGCEVLWLSPSHWQMMQDYPTLEVLS